MRYNLKALREAANAAIDLARERKGEFNEAINWGNLACVSAEFTVNDEGDSYHTVIIEEAGDCPRFRVFIGAILDAGKFKDVAITTEW